MSCHKCGSERVWKPMDTKSVHLAICEECMKTTTEEEFNEIWERLEVNNL